MTLRQRTTLLAPAALVAALRPAGGAEVSQAALALFLTLAQQAYAIPVPHRKLADLVEAADVVAIGTVTSTADIGLTSVDTPNKVIPARLMLGEFLPEEILKGPSDLSAIRFYFKVPAEFVGYPTVKASSRRAVFLRRQDDHYVLVSPHYPSVVAAPRARGEAATPIDRLVRAVGEVLRLESATSEEKREAIYVLWDAKTPASLDALKVPLKDGDPTVRLTAAAALVAAGDLAALSITEGALLRETAALAPELRQNLQSALRHGVMSDAAVPVLGRLMDAGDEDTRRAAVSALGRVRSRTAISALGRALDDPDFDVRLGAVRGLALLAGEREWSPSDDAFRADEGRYLKHWKEWLERQ